MCILSTNLNKMLHQVWLVQTQNFAEIFVSAEIPFVNLNLSRISSETKISDLSKISAEIWLSLETFCETGPWSLTFPKVFFVGYWIYNFTMGSLWLINDIKTTCILRQHEAPDSGFLAIFYKLKDILAITAWLLSVILFEICHFIVK